MKFQRIKSFYASIQVYKTLNSYRTHQSNLCAAHFGVYLYDMIFQREACLDWLAEGVIKLEQKQIDDAT